MRSKYRKVEIAYYMRSRIRDFVARPTLDVDVRGLIEATENEFDLQDDWDYSGRNGRLWHMAWDIAKQAGYRIPPQPWELS